MATYTEKEQKFVSEFVDLMQAAGYRLLSGTQISTDDVSFRDTRVQRSQLTSLCFLSGSSGAMALVDFHTFGPNCGDAWMHLPTLKLKLAANFKHNCHSIFRDKFFSYPHMGSKARLLFNCFDLTGDTSSRQLPHIVDGIAVEDQYTYFQSWEFRAVLDTCCDAKKDATFFMEDLDKALRELDELTHPFTKVFMSTWPPEDQFPGCSNTYWERWREHINMDVAQPIWKAMRNS